MCPIILCTASFCLCYFVQATAADLTQFSCHHFLLAKMKLREGQGYCATSITRIMSPAFSRLLRILGPSFIQALSVASLCGISGFFYFCLSLSNQWANSVLIATTGCLLCVTWRSPSKSFLLVSTVTYISIWVKPQTLQKASHSWNI